MQKPAKKWLMASIHLVGKNDPDLISHACFEAGAAGCEEREALVIAWFPEQNAAALQQHLNEYLQRLYSAALIDAVPHISLTVVEEQDWHSGWRRFFKPILVSDVFCVRPPWEKSPKQVAHEIVIEPKQAFGTGNHATTWLLLSRIAELGDDLPLRALDVGTGSGILAIAHALRRPESRITACDIDPVAIENARENLEINRVEKQVSLFVGSLQACGESPFPLIYANLQSHIILPDLEKFMQLASNGGLILFSGILAEEEDKMRRALGDFPCELCEIIRRDEWIAMTVRKNA